MGELPPRGPALSDRLMLVSFDLDCGELVRGHLFVARGIALQGESLFSLEYELVPGVPPDGELFDYLVGVTYEADVPLPWEPADGGAIAPFYGGAATHGSRGDWPLPAEARVLTFTLYPVEGRFPVEDPAGRLVVDLGTQTAAWVPVPTR